MQALRDGRRGCNSHRHSPHELPPVRAPESTIETAARGSNNQRYSSACGNETAAD
jgi:hypothetical protein